MKALRVLQRICYFIIVIHVLAAGTIALVWGIYPLHGYSGRLGPYHI
jgi:hypothetical protein